MHKFIVRSLLPLLVAAFVLMMLGDNSINQRVRASSAVPADPNPLLAKWSGPYGGVPPFDKVQVALFKPALESAMAENLSEIDKIANDSSSPTFDNTIVALETAGHTLDRVTTIYGIWGSTMASPEFQTVQREMGIVKT